MLNCKRNNERWALEEHSRRIEVAEVEMEEGELAGGIDDLHMHTCSDTYQLQKEVMPE